MLSVLCHLNALRLRADNVYAIGLKSVRKIERSLAAKLDNGGPTFFMLGDVENIFEGQRLEIKFVARIVVGRDRFRIRIYHDCLKPLLLQSKRGVHATVIKLDALPDSIGSAAKDHHLLAIATGGFV